MRGAALSAVMLGTIGGGLVVATVLPSSPRAVVVGSYVTPLQGRSAGQRHNARLAASAIDGTVIPAGGVFSYNRKVRAWDTQPGYVRAPVSFGGAMVRALGGGVCQTSSTLYNAALLAGLQVLERHPHTVAPRYVPPGRDAAVAYPGIDLRLQNPHPFPITVRARADDDRVTVRMEAPRAIAQRIVIHTQTLSFAGPRRRLVIGAPHGQPGAPGWRIVTSCTRFQPGAEPRTKRLSDDTYLPLDRVVAVP
jgi:vancomycin resistance protein YoaR